MFWTLYLDSASSSTWRTHRTTRNIISRKIGNEVVSIISGLGRRVSWWLHLLQLLMVVKTNFWWQTKRREKVDNCWTHTSCQSIERHHHHVSSLLCIALSNDSLLFFLCWKELKIQKITWGFRWMTNDRRFVTINLPWWEIESFLCVWKCENNRIWSTIWDLNSKFLYKLLTQKITNKNLEIRKYQNAKIQKIQKNLSISL